MPIFKRPQRSLRFQFTLGVLIMIVPLIGMLFYYHFYSIQVVREQVSDSYKNTLSLYMNQIDSNLNDIDAYLNTLAGPGSGYSLVALQLADDDTEYYMAKSNLYNQLNKDRTLYELIDSFFVYAKHREDYMDLYSAGVTYGERELLKEYVSHIIEKGDIPAGIKTKRWRHAKVGQYQYLINIAFMGDMYVGGWIRIDELLKPLEALQLGDGGTVLIADNEGLPLTNTQLVYDQGISLQRSPNDYYISGEAQRYLTVGMESYRGNFQLVALIPERSILSNLPYLKKVIWLITIVVLIFIPLGLYHIRKVLLVPIKRILLVMSRVRVGDWGVRVKLEKDTEEFRILGHSFNTMMEEMQTLRVNVLEEQLHKQREELQRLQLQVNPHFFLNSLNIVYNLAKVKNYQLIMEMSDSLIDYFRFLFRSNTSFVKLHEELEHIGNYMHIQNLRFPEQLIWKLEAPDYLGDIPVPPLVIQSFVENSIKHAITMEEPLQIHLNIGFEEGSDGSKIRITVQDTGKGFAEPILQELQAGNSVENKQGEHTGIWNVQRRLRLIYKEEVSIQFDNDKVTGGAIVEIVIPTHPEKERVQ